MEALSFKYILRVVEIYAIIAPIGQPTIVLVYFLLLCQVVNKTKSETEYNYGLF